MPVKDHTLLIFELQDFKAWLKTGFYLFLLILSVLIIFCTVLQVYGFISLQFSYHLIDIIFGFYVCLFVVNIKFLKFNDYFYSHYFKLEK